MIEKAPTTKSKVFGLGFHKTGTTSLAAALTVLGYRVTGPNFFQQENLPANLLSLTSNMSHDYDAFQDSPWPLVYLEMDKKWPDARFVLTIRDEKNWINSQVNHFGEKTNKMRELIYGESFGSPVGNEQHYIDRMRRHNADVIAYFADRTDKLLVMDIESGDGWSLLCEFLNVNIPAESFPKIFTE